MTALSGQDFDVLVIGGGITGCGVARDAAMRGLRVALVEREDFASGTSGRSSRLIHGGIRYLEHAQFHLVHESIRERQILLQIAPHLVKQLAFTWPVYRGARVGRVKLSAGLILYGLMAGGGARRHSTLNEAETIAREPSLKRAGLTGGAVYYDACTDDGRLTLANAISAAQHGAVVLNHTRVTEILRDRGRAVGVVVKTSAGTSEEVRARTIVSATGVWPNSFSESSQDAARGSKGVHIAVPRDRIDNRDALTLISPVDGRVMFCLPAGPQAIIGTTDTWTSENPETVHAAQSDIEYLLRSANAYFPAAALAPEDVVSAWAGIRPLAATSAANPGAASREHSIITDGTGVIHITGGKLTTYRAMASEIVDVVQRALGVPVEPGRTDVVELPGADRATELLKLQRQDPVLAEPLIPSLVYTRAHLVYAARREMARSLSDVLIRRTHVAFETRDHGMSVSAHAADIIAPVLGWDEREKSARVREYQQDVERIFRIG
ncbi:MAG TPA: glycerol-3-phosphate dehydrogenase/oxidase [Gemmatimonadaceae bacterium]|nr:glycerol-3-phosphate dehydrogenase/oxidase [Gemmatimonadaceae bacterium]